MERVIEDAHVVIEIIQPRCAYLIVTLMLQCPSS
jgi:hypothetical protein